MLGDAHSTNYAENRDFFLNQNNPTNFERTWNTAYFLYKAIRAVDREDAVRPGDGLLGHQEARQPSPSTPSRRTSTSSSSRPTTGIDVNVESAVLTKTVMIHFFPNSYDINKKIPAQGRQGARCSTIPTSTYTIEEIGKLAGQFGAARIVIEGHTDASMRGRRRREPGAASCRCAAPTR